MDVKNNWIIQIKTDVLRFIIPAWFLLIILLKLLFMAIFRSFYKSIIWAFSIVFLSLLSGDKLPDINKFYIPHFDKLVHFGFYFGLTILLIHDIMNYKQWHTKRIQIAFLAVITAVFLGGALELLQHIQSLHRSRDVYDFYANSIGAITGVFMFKYFNPLLIKAERLFIKS